MKILAVTDMHGEFQPLVNYLKSNPVDLVILAGDITHFGPRKLGEDILNEICSYDVPVMAIPGNCDPEFIHGEIESSRAVNIHARCLVVKNVGICGFGGSNPTPFNTPLEFEEVEIYDEAKKALEGIKDHEVTIFVTHTPPHGTSTDLLPSGEHAGSTSLRRLIEEFQPTINICGHIHESRGTDRIGETQVLNPGKLDEGYGCLIHIPEEEKTRIKTKIIALDSNKSKKQ
ncbi:MAG: metallophosphoesterase [Euryarchaeota archaeon]|jgi:Icc-related predicted phosphoesterase|nr:metallophosphoesterase [Euryarchaeota archaeon]